MPSETWIYVGGFVAALLIFGGFIHYLTRVQARMGLAPDGPAPDRTERTRSGGNVATSTITPPPPAAPAAQQPDASAGPAAVAFNAVWHHLMKAVHLMLVGETGSGKSTAARAVLAGRIQASEVIVILDPHSTPETWAGLKAIGAGRDFAAIDTVMAQLLAEMTRRYEALAGDAGYRPDAMTIFVDEWPAIQSHCKQAKAFMTQLAQEGRKAGMRLVILTQSDLVASLGIEGKGDVRSNFLMLLLGTKAIARCAESLAMPRPAALRRGENEARAADVSGMLAQSDALDTSRAITWRAASDCLPLPMKPAETEPALDPLWQRFLNGEDLLEPELETGSDGVALVIAEGEPVAERTSTPTSGLAALDQGKPVVRTSENSALSSVPANLPADEVSVLIRAAHAAGMSRNKMTQVLVIPGGRADQLKYIKAALGEVEL